MTRTHPPLNAKAQNISDSSSSRASASHGRSPSTVYPCNWPGCTKICTQKINLKQHMRTHTKERPYVCTVCGRDFGAQTTLNNHIGAEHYKLRYFCPSIGCEARYTRRATFRSHFLRKHGTDVPEIEGRTIEDDRASGSEPRNVQQQQQQQQRTPPAGGSSLFWSSSEQLPSTSYVRSGGEPGFQPWMFPAPHSSPPEPVPAMPAYHPQNPSSEVGHHLGEPMHNPQLGYQMVQQHPHQHQHQHQHAHGHSHGHPHMTPARAASLGMDMSSLTLEESHHMHMGGPPGGPSYSG
ncbi:hypothetical protein BOTBODRAFT_36314 [Botryobasidium botryosum FD-172 SS1]|uniref:C2H2-type domain-containing protein n=1 Tax=Botryobasidium botryosum (strain FD-172 SS1) TaxID=930990 RepID=A0A067M4E6_BOTB1|nr:hypothetical protein BOTBODRAFT_36314 [Botryobasidium botryosum FD-172 SS1]